MREEEKYVLKIISTLPVGFAFAVRYISVVFLEQSQEISANTAQVPSLVDVLLPDTSFHPA